jgi:hypothetical protein
MDHRERRDGIEDEIGDEIARERRRKASDRKAIIWVVIILGAIALVYGSAVLLKPREHDPQSRKHQYVVIDDLASARFLSRPPDGSVLGRIPSGTKLRILDERRVQTGMTSQNWYRVKWAGKEGWISEYVTTGAVLSE